MDTITFEVKSTKEQSVRKLTCASTGVAVTVTCPSDFRFREQLVVRVIQAIAVNDEGREVVVVSEAVE